jgi:tRNA(Arg) A34 adenosine deaminase TadA
MIPASYKPRKKFMELAVAEAKRAGDRGDYPIGAVITRLTGKREVVIASAGNRATRQGARWVFTETGKLSTSTATAWPI